MLKIEDIFLINQLKFCFRLLNNNYTIVHRNRVYHVFAEKCNRFSIPSLMNFTNKNIINKINTHSFASFVQYAKYQFLDNYTNQYSIPLCYVCHQNR